ncbi:type VI secretion system Vgr family protein [Paraburkholderia caffeinilytica]|uniref:type VI secretion system Vgr family protein n=1 Tax=Paraburkholderia caffeinilytica TaxID=1761016 RepID=UPI003DA149E3
MQIFRAERTLSVSGAALPNDLDGMPVMKLGGIQGQESLSELYEYTLDLLSLSEPGGMSRVEAASLDLASMIGKELTVSIALDRAQSGTDSSSDVRQISGLVADARSMGYMGRQGLYRVCLRPWLFLADQCSNYRIFQMRTVVEIVDEVLAGYAYSYERRLSGQYPALEYQVQYGETDFAFIQRLMQENGIYWFFEHANGIHRLVLADHMEAHMPQGAQTCRDIYYHPQGYGTDRPYVHAFESLRSLQPGQWRTDDFDFTKPAARLQAVVAEPQDTVQNGFEKYEWPGDYTTLPEGQRMARLRMEELYAYGARACGEGNLREVVCGKMVRLLDHPVAQSNAEYLVLKATLSATEIAQTSGSANFEIRSKFVVQPSSVAFRPCRTVAKPRTSGPQTAIVTGPSGQEVWTDQYGRVKIRFHWDRASNRGENASCWIRVSHAWAGNSYGSIHIPRIGSEVIVDFENGDPDRPIITGRVFNGVSVPPWPLPANATQSGVLSRSTRGGGYDNANAIRFEDKLGEEELWIHAERDQRTEVERDETHDVGQNRRRTVGADESVTIGANRSKNVGESEAVVIGGKLIAQVAEISGELVGLAKALIAGGGYVVVVGGAHALIVAGAVEEVIGTGRVEQVGGAKVTNVIGLYEMTAGVRLRLACGASEIEMLPDGTINLRGNVVIQSA